MCIESLDETALGHYWSERHFVDGDVVMFLNGSWTWRVVHVYERPVVRQSSFRVTSMGCCLFSKTFWRVIRDSSGRLRSRKRKIRDLDPIKSGAISSPFPNERTWIETHLCLAVTRQKLLTKISIVS